MNPKSNRRAVHLILLLSCACLVSACGLSGDGISPNTVGSLSVCGTLQQLGVGDVAEAQIIVSRGNHILEYSAAVTGQEFSVDLEIPIGTWELTILLLDSDGTVQYQNEPQTVVISPDNPTALDVLLRPGDGIIKLSIDLSGTILEETVRRARVYFDEELFELTWEDLEEPFAGEFTLAPGSYDFCIELYTNSFRASDKVVPGIWRVFEVAPQEEFHLNWRPFSQSLHVDASIYLVPDPPQNVTTQLNDNQVELSWNASTDPYVTGYFVYFQTDPFERPTLLTPVPTSAPFCTHSLDELELEQPTKIRYTVSCVGAQGIVGYRSEESAITY